MFLIFLISSQPNILFEEEHEHVLHDDWEEHNVKNFFFNLINLSSCSS